MIIISDYILLSGLSWETGFHETAIQAIKRCLWDTGRLLYIASEPDNYEKNDKNARAIAGWLRQNGIAFKACDILDKRMTEQEQTQSIMRASCVFLGGGDTLAQIDYLKAQSLIEPLRRFEGLIIGLSAGSINMAKRSVLLVNPYRKHTWVYEGIGLADVTVIPHFDPAREEFYRTELFPLTYDGPIYGLCDDAVIVIRNGKKAHLGTIYEIDRGQMRLMQDEEIL